MEKSKISGAAMVKIEVEVQVFLECSLKNYLAHFSNFVDEIKIRKGQVGMFFTSSCVNFVRAAVLPLLSLLYIQVFIKHLLNQVQFSLPNYSSSLSVKRLQNVFLETLTYFCKGQGIGRKLRFHYHFCFLSLTAHMLFPHSFEDTI